MRCSYIWAISLLLVATASKEARACVCVEQILSDREAAASEFKAAAVVFEGEFVSSTLRPASQGASLAFRVSEITFRVIRSYKGSSAETITVYDESGDSDCGFGNPDVGEQFFVYGFQGKDGKIYIHACDRTAGLEQAAADTRYARGEPATDEDLAPAGEKWRLFLDPSLSTRGASLSGSVRRSDGGTVTEVFLTVWGIDENGVRNGQIAASQKVNPDGSFEVRYLPPGNYLVTALDSELRSDARFVGQFGLVSLKPSERLGGVAVLLNPEPLGTVKIRVEAPSSIHDRIFVWLRDAGIDKNAPRLYAYADTANLDSTGEASFQFVPYALYDVEVLLEGDDMNRPSWTHDAITVELKGPHAEAVVRLRETSQDESKIPH